jgi:hypothetical protein
MIYPEPATLKRGSSKLEELPITHNRPSEARAILRHSSDLAADILAGRLPCNDLTAM